MALADEHDWWRNQEPSAKSLSEDNESIDTIEAVSNPGASVGFVENNDTRDGWARSPCTCSLVDNPVVTTGFDQFGSIALPEPRRPCVDTESQLYVQAC
jgi:hypothetical protein